MQTGIYTAILNLRALVRNCLTVGMKCFLMQANGEPDGMHFGYADGSNRQSRNKHVPPYECADVPDEGYPDGLTANLAVKKLRALSKGENLLSGSRIFKPHLPFTAPRKYWDLYDENAIPLSPVPNIPEGICRYALHNSGEFNGYLEGDERASLDKSVSEVYARKLRHAYLHVLAT